MLDQLERSERTQSCGGTVIGCCKQHSLEKSWFDHNSELVRCREKPIKLQRDSQIGIVWFVLFNLPFPSCQGGENIKIDLNITLSRGQFVLHCSLRLVLLLLNEKYIALHVYELFVIEARKQNWMRELKLLKLPNGKICLSQQNEFFAGVFWN